MLQKQEKALRLLDSCSLCGHHFFSEVASAASESGARGSLDGLHIFLLFLVPDDNARFGWNVLPRSAAYTITEPLLWRRVADELVSPLKEPFHVGSVGVPAVVLSPRKLPAQ